MINEVNLDVYLDLLLEWGLVEEDVRSASNFRTLIAYLDKKYKNKDRKIDKAFDLIRSYLAAIRSGNGMTAHQKGTEISRLTSAVSVYYESDSQDMKDFAHDEYAKAMKEIMKRIFGKK